MYTIGFVRQRFHNDRILSALKLLYLQSFFGIVFLTGCASGFPDKGLASDKTKPIAFNAELAYFETVAMKATEIDSQVLLLLFLEYQSSDRRAEGINFFTKYIESHGDQMLPAHRVFSLSALGILRAGEAPSVPLLKRTKWVNDTITILEEARYIGGNEVFFNRLATGLVYAQLPTRFEKSVQAREDLNWLVANAELADNPGLMRLVYQKRAELGMEDVSGRHILQTGATDNLTTNFTVSPVHGATFYPQKFEEILPGRVFLVSGLEFTEYYFILSADRQELIAIDAGTRPDFAEAAYNILLENVANIPQLSSVFVTHAHWDHVGGHTFFRELNPSAKFYGRDNFSDEVRIMEAGPGNEFNWFFGESFEFSNVKAYRPDVAISKRQSYDIGGTSIVAFPAPGSETPDAMFIYMPEERLLFVGDFIMPFSGAPFIEEGDIGALLESIDLIDTINPVRLLHGHQPLTDFFASPADTRAFKAHLSWLAEETKMRIRAGQTRGQIHRQNLIPESILENAQSQQFYLVMREQVINRLYDQAIGYWEPELAGLDTLDTKSYGAFLSRYLALNEDETVVMINTMIDAGDYHLAERVLRWALAEWSDSSRLTALQKQAALKLRLKYQNYNPFKFFLYSELANEPLSQLR